MAIKKLVALAFVAEDHKGVVVVAVGGNQSRHCLNSERTKILTGGMFPLLNGTATNDIILPS